MLTVLITGIFALSIGLVSYNHINNLAVTETELGNNKENVIFISETIEKDLLELVRLTTALASTNIIKDSLALSNSEFTSLTISEREDTINDLNTTWMNTDDINDPFIKSRMENDVASFLISQQAANPGLYGEIFLTNEYGVMISTTGKLTTLAHYDKYWWQGAFDDGNGIVYLDDRGYDDSVDGYVLGIVVPVYDDQDNIIGILKSNFNIEYIFENSVSQFHNLNPEGEYLVVRTLGLIVDGYDIEPLSESIPNGLLSFLEQRTNITREFKIDDTDKFVAIAPINITFDSDILEFGGSYESTDHTSGNLGEGWSVVYIINRSVALSETRNTMSYLGVVSVILLGLISITGYFSGASLSRPFVKLNNFITEVGQGNLEKRELNVSGYEIGNLKKSFDGMIENLKLTLISKDKLEESEARLAQANNIAKLGYIEFDIESNKSRASREAYDIFELEYNPEYVELSPIMDMIDVNDRKRVISARHNLINRTKPYDIEFTIHCKNGKTKYIRSIAELECDTEGKPIKIIGVNQDITESKLSQERLEYERNNAQMYLDVAGVMLLVLDNKGNISLINKKGCEILGCDANEIIGKNWFDNYVPKDTAENVKTIFKNIVTGNYDFASHYENAIITETGEERMINWYNTILYDINRNIIGILSSGEDITEARKDKENLIRIGYEDSLTKLKNRRYFEEKIREIDIVDNYPLTIIMADINGLKLINDAFGHSAGDELLISCANLISSLCSEEDISARIGGDEFVVVLPNTDETKAEKFIKRINVESKKIIIEAIPLSISFGYKIKHHEKEDIQEIYRSAEDAMYREKLLEIPSMRSGAIETILSTLYEKDKSSEIHSRSVSDISEGLAKAYGMNRQDVAEVKTAGLLHDIGKIIIPLEIINKKGKLTSEEYESMKTHSEIGFRILNSTSDMRSISNIVLNHHERWDGKGYPRGIKSDEIPLKSRIISIADAFDAMTSDRTYRDIVSDKQAVKEIIDNAGTQFDPKLAKLFEKHYIEIIAK
jgi:diguanylate cyclase (GGDEF)-like protein/PAS domain S-box-containing protein/putative nucleotidyltransferase with HDIG domain